MLFLRKHGFILLIQEIKFQNLEGNLFESRYINLTVL